MIELVFEHLALLQALVLLWLHNAKFCQNCLTSVRA